MMINVTQKPYVNLGCGTIILPGEQPGHHNLIDPAIYDYPLWLNVDRNDAPGVDEVVDIFRYPWPWPDNSFDGALLSHLVEHIPHEIREAGYIDDLEGDAFYRADKRLDELENCQDGWFAFFAELYRVLTPGAVAHVLCPYGWSQGAITDPTHTRMITEHTWSHSMQPDPNHPSFRYDNGGINFELVGGTQRFGLYANWRHLLPKADDDEGTLRRKSFLFNEALMTHINVVNDMAVQLRAVK